VALPHPPFVRVGVGVHRGHFQMKKGGGKGGKGENVTERSAS